MNTDRVAIVGGGYSSLVVIDRMLAAKPNLKQPIQVLVGSAQDPVKDSVFREYVDFINSDAFVKNVTNPKVEAQPGGKSVVTLTESSGKKQTFTYASDIVVLKEMRDTLGNVVPGKFYLAQQRARADVIGSNGRSNQSNGRFRAATTRHAKPRCTPLLPGASDGVLGLRWT